MPRRPRLFSPNDRRRLEATLRGGGLVDLPEKPELGPKNPASRHGCGLAAIVQQSVLLKFIQLFQYVV
jgi:hypothetical protein